MLDIIDVVINEDPVQHVKQPIHQHHKASTQYFSKVESFFLISFPLLVTLILVSAVMNGEGGGVNGIE